VPYQVQYGYDARSQLTSEKSFQNNNFILELDYTYDPAGNRTRLVRTDPTTSDSPVTVVSTYAADNQIAQAVRTAPLDPTQTTTYGEDANGNLTQAAGSSGTTTYGYDFENRLRNAALPSSMSVRFLYNADGLRVQKVGTGGGVTRYVLDGLQVVLEKDGSGATQVRYMPGLARIASGAVGYYLEDRLGSVVGLADANQNLTDTFRYDAWGSLLQHQGMTATAYQWVGEEGYYLNADVVLYLLGKRYYSLTSGRFLTRDPIGFRGGINAYAYVSNNAANFTDPEGLLVGYVIAALAVLVTACGLPQHNAAHSRYPNSGDKFKHCWVSCRISKTCGNLITELAGLGKEGIDAIKRILGSDPSAGTWLDSLRDLVANQQCIGWEGWVFGPFGSWVGAACRESCDACCRRRVGFNAT